MICWRENGSEFSGCLVAERPRPSREGTGAAALGIGSRRACPGGRSRAQEIVNTAAAGRCRVWRSGGGEVVEEVWGEAGRSARWSWPWQRGGEAEVGEDAADGLWAVDVGDEAHGCRASRAARGPFAVLARAARVCGWCPLAAGALCSGGARVPPVVLTLGTVLSQGSWASETPPDAEKPVHNREPMVHGSRVGQRLGFFTALGSPDETVVRDSISRKLRRMGSLIRNDAPHRESTSGAGEQSRTLRSHWPNTDLRIWLRWSRPKHRWS